MGTRLIAADIALHRRELDLATWTLCRMSLALRGLEADIVKGSTDSFLDGLHGGPRADCVLAQPLLAPGGWSDGGTPEDARWAIGVPPIRHRVATSKSPPHISAFQQWAEALFGCSSRERSPIGPPRRPMTSTEPDGHGQPATQSLR